MSNERQMGTIEWFNGKKRFGFINPTENEEGNDVFAHIDNLQEDKDGNKPELQKGDQVSFMLGDPPQNNKKQEPEAKDIKLEKSSDDEQEEQK